MKMPRFFRDNVYSLTCQGQAMVGALTSGLLQTAFFIGEAANMSLSLSPPGPHNLITTGLSLLAGGLLGDAVYRQGEHNQSLAYQDTQDMWRSERKVAFNPFASVVLAAFITTATEVVPPLLNKAIATEIKQSKTMSPPSAVTP